MVSNDGWSGCTSNLSVVESDLVQIKPKVYKVEKVYADSDHRLAHWVRMKGENEDIFIIWEDGWELAENFFLMHNVKEFLVVDNA